MSKTLLVWIMLMELAGLLFADIGPGPASPSIVLVLTQNGAAYSGVAYATYLCSWVNATTPNNHGALAPAHQELACQVGQCTNPSWYYKFNPCFYSTGRLQVVANGNNFTSPEISLESPGTYRFSMDVGTGEFTSSPPSSLPFTCLGGLILPGALGLGLLRYRLA